MEQYNLSSQVLMGIKARSISLLSSNHYTTNSLFNNSYSRLIHTIIEPPLLRNPYQSITVQGVENHNGECQANLPDAGTSSPWWAIKPWRSCELNQLTLFLNRCVWNFCRRLHIPPIQYDTLRRLHGYHLFGDIHSYGSTCNAPKWSKPTGQVSLISRSYQSTGNANGNQFKDYENRHIVSIIYDLFIAFNMLSQRLCIPGWMDKGFPRDCFILVSHVTLWFCGTKRPTQSWVLCIFESSKEIQHNQNNGRLVVVEG
jgi:hypothetical protein